MRQSLGSAVFFGMLGVTGFGLVFTPGFYIVVRRLVAWLNRNKPHHHRHDGAPTASQSAK
jgi:HAE1 family hydrophobic/amphiphilic exporter-1